MVQNSAYMVQVYGLAFGVLCLRAETQNYLLPQICEILPTSITEFLKSQRTCDLYADAGYWRMDSWPIHLKPFVFIYQKIAKHYKYLLNNSCAPDTTPWFPGSISVFRRSFTILSSSRKVAFPAHVGYEIPWKLSSFKNPAPNLLSNLRTIADSGGWIDSDSFCFHLCQTQQP